MDGVSVCGAAQEEDDVLPAAGSSQSGSDIVDILLSGRSDLSLRMREMKDLFEASACGKVGDIIRVLNRIEKTQEVEDSKKTGISSSQQPSTHCSILAGFKDGNGRNALHFACSGGKLKNVNFLLDRCPTLAHAADSGGETAVFVASKLDNAGALRALIEAGASLKPTLPHGLSPLHCAVTAQSKKCCEALLDAGADVNTATTNLGTPLQYAVFNNDIEITSLLLSRGANPNLNDPSLALPSALTYACDAGNAELVRLLLDCGADPNLSTNETDHGPLQTACHRGHFNVVKQLLDFNASPLLKIHGVTASSLAGGHPEISALMSSHIQNSLANGHRSDKSSSVVSELKRRGNELFSREKYKEADEMYARALQLLDVGESANRGILYANRCHCLVKAGEAGKAIEFGIRAVAANKTWAKAHYRLATAYQEDNQMPMALKSLDSGLLLDPGNKEISKKRKVISAKIEAAKSNPTKTSSK